MAMKPQTRLFSGLQMAFFRPTCSLSLPIEKIFFSSSAAMELTDIYLQA